MISRDHSERAGVVRLTSGDLPECGSVLGAGVAVRIADLDVTQI